MGWFDDQIKQRQMSDQEAFEASFEAIAGAVMGRRLSDALNDDRQVTTDAIGEILRYYRVNSREVPEKLQDMNEILEYLLRPYGIMRRNVRLERGWQKDAIGAMLGTRKDDGSVVALVPHGLCGYRFYDRKKGCYVRVNKKTAELIEVDAIAFYKPFPLKEMGLKDLLGYIVKLVAPADMVMLVTVVAAVTLVGMVMPELNKLLFSKVLASGSVQKLISIGIFMICASLSALVFGMVREFVAARIGTRLSINVESATMMRVLSLPASFFKEYSAGELSNRIGCINTMTEMMVNTVMSVGLTSIFSLAYVFQILRYAPALMVPALLMIFLTLMVSVITVFMQMRVTKKQMLLASKESGICHGLIGGVQKVRLAGAERRAFARWGQVYAESASLLYNPPLLLRVSGVISMAISLIGTGVLYYAAVQSGVSVSDYYAFNVAYGLVSGAFLSLAGVASTIAQIKPALEMVKPIFMAVPEIDENKAMVTSLSGGIELNNIVFRYKEDMPLIIDNLSLKIRPGQYVAIVGKTGCGKSTLMRILLGFEKPQKGAVYYDGKDLNTLDPKSLRRRIGTVMQDGKLFMGDIFSNLVICAPWLKLEDAWEAAEIAGFADDIKNMPMGMHTMISEGAGGISGGQRQRLMIARAIAPKPKILMFDEATSALDNVTQKRVSDALDQMNCTRIVIAHRLSTIRQCDRIIVLDKGRIIEDGSYDELMEKSGYFSELVSRQRLDETAFVGHTTAF